MEYRDSLAVDLTKWEYQAPDTQKEIAYHRLEEKIVLLEFSPGVVVTEKDLAESIGLGRTPVREANSLSDTVSYTHLTLPTIYSV